MIRQRGQTRAQRLLLVLILLLTSVEGRMVFAAMPEAEQQARRMFESAEEHFRNGLFAEALAEYQAGYDISPLPGFLINIAQCQRRMGRLAVAKATYRKFIMVAPDSPFVPQVKALIVELDALTQDLPDAPVAGQEKTETASLNEGTQAATEVQHPTAPVASQTSAELTAVPATPVVQPPSKTRWWLWGLIGAAAAGAITTVVLVAMPPGNKTLHDGSVGTLRR